MNVDVCKWFFVIMCVYVESEIVYLMESFVVDVVFEGFFFSVSEFVIFIIVFLMKIFVVNIVYKWFVISVDVDVSV